MAERKAVLDEVVDEAGGRVPIIAGIVEYSEFGHRSFEEALPCVTIKPYSATQKTWRLKLHQRVQGK